MPKVSVIVPIYNTEKYLERSIDSILEQTFTDFELLLIDDGSTDSSGVICDKYAERDSRVRVFHKSNGGVSKARNLGLDKAIGEYIIFIDSDDYWYDVTALELLFEAAKNYDLDIVRGEYKCVDATGKFLFERPITKAKKEFSKKNISSGKFYTQIMKRENFLFLSLIRYRAIGDLRFDINRSFLEDMEFFVRIFLQPLRCMFIPIRFYAYRLLPSSASHTLKIKNLEDSFSMHYVFDECSRRTKDQVLSNAYRYNSIMMYYWTLCTLSEFYYPLRRQIIKDLSLKELQKRVAVLSKRNIFKYPIPVFLSPKIGCYIIRKYIYLKRVVRKLIDNLKTE